MQKLIHQNYREGREGKAGLIIKINAVLVLFPMHRVWWSACRVEMVMSWLV